jgi:hypothetical protein
VVSDPQPVRNDVGGYVVGNVVQAGVISVAAPASRPIAVAGLPVQAVSVGREHELAQLVDALKPTPATDSPAAAVLVWSVGGLPGVGKTALAVRAAQDALAAGWFPGDVVMADLHGYDPPGQRVSASTALVGLLGVLGATTATATSTTKPHTDAGNAMPWLQPTWWFRPVGQHIQRHAQHDRDDGKDNEERGHAGSHLGKLPTGNAGTVHGGEPRQPKLTSGLPSAGHVLIPRSKRMSLPSAVRRTRREARAGRRRVNPTGTSRCREADVGGTQRRRC